MSIAERPDRNVFVRYIVQLLLFPTPWFIRRRVLAHLFNMDLHRTSKIGFSFIDAERVTMGEGARIGHLTIVKGLSLLYLGDHSRLGNGNWVTGWRTSSQHFRAESERISVLSIGNHSAVTNRHLIDCTDSVLVGEYSTIAGWGSQILTHAIDLVACRQSCAPVQIGDYCFVGTRSVILKGSVFPAKSVLAPGSVLAGETTADGWLYGGVPARPIKAIGKDQGYFIRPVGFVV